MKTVLLVLLLFSTLAGYSFPHPSKEHVEVFNSLVAECVAFQRRPEVALSASAFLHQKFSPYIQLQNRCGLESLELIYGVLKKSLGHNRHDYRPLVDLWSDITCDGCADWIIPWNPVGIVYAWEGGAEFEDEQISFLLSEMRLAAKEGRKNDELVAKQIISCEGIFSFPKLFAELEAGREDVVDILKLVRWSAKERPNSFRVKALLDWWAENKEKYALPQQSPDFKKTKNIHNWKRTGK